MSINHSINLNQSQKLILTNQLKQSLSILSMNLQELEETIIKEGEENPTIEIDRKDNIDWEDYISKHYNTKEYSNYSYNDEDEYNFENMVCEDKTLYEYLKEQINYYKISEADKNIAHYIIDSLDEDGYLRMKSDDLCKVLKINDKKLTDILSIIQTLEPSGVGARSLEECLLIQLNEKEINNSLLKEIINNDLENIARRKYKDISKKYEIPMQKFLELYNIIKSLNPKPGNIFSSSKDRYIIPDVIAQKVGDEFVLYSNDKTIPTIKINNFYKEVLKDVKKDENAKEFIKEKLNNASSLIKNIESRKNTILKIAYEILKQQREFFENGNKYLKPMTLKDMADNINCHESTISRGINGKYMLTPFGLFEFKYFFSLAVKSSDDVATNSVKNMIKEIVEAENKKKPYSDQKISEILKLKNIDIPRRTIAKYREEIGIESSSKRKIY